MVNFPSQRTKLFQYPALFFHSSELIKLHNFSILKTNPPRFSWDLVKKQKAFYPRKQV